jgi:hypothetical protein
VDHTRQNRLGRSPSNSSFLYNSQVSLPSDTWTALDKTRRYYFYSEEAATAYRYYRNYSVGQEPPTNTSPPFDNGFGFNLYGLYVAGLQDPYCRLSDLLCLDSRYREGPYQEEIYRPCYKVATNVTLSPAPF